jgi:Mg2+-importing ATPase
MTAADIDSKSGASTVDAGTPGAKPAGPPTHAHEPPTFQTGWFVESLTTQTLIVHFIRTNKIPFLQSRANWVLTVTTLSIMVFGMWLPYSRLAPALVFTHLPRMYWPILMLTQLGYISLTQVIKMGLLRKQWI